MYYDDNAPSPGTIGSHHTLSGDAPPRDPVAELRQVVEEVTRQPLPAKPPMRFY